MIDEENDEDDDDDEEEEGDKLTMKLFFSNIDHAT